MGISEVGGRRWEETGDQKDEMRMEWDRKWGNDARSLAVLLDGRWMGARRLCGAHQLRVQHLLPAVQALHVRPKRHIQRDLLPVAAAVPGNRHTELRVLWGRRVVSARPVEQRRGSRASSWAGKRGADLLRRPLGLLLRAGGPAAEGKTLQWVSSMRNRCAQRPNGSAAGAALLRSGAPIVRHGCCGLRSGFGSPGRRGSRGADGEYDGGRVRKMECVTAQGERYN